MNLKQKITKIVKENEREIKTEIIKNAINGFKVVVYYNMDDEKIHADTITQGTIMCNNEIVLNHIDANWIDCDDFDEEGFILFYDIVDYNIFINELEQKGDE